MKKVLFLSLIFSIMLSLPDNSHAQFKLKIGPTTGMNFNIGTGSDVEETYTGFAFMIGAQADMSFNRTIGLITNIQLYDNRSASSSTEATTQGVSYTVKDNLSLAYFLIEPLFKLSIPSSGFFFLVGPEFGFTVSSSRTLKISSENDQVKFQDGSTKSKSSLKDTNARLALKFGAGYDIPVSNLVTLTPQLQFGYGLTNVMENVAARILSIQTLVTVKFRML